MEQQLNGLQTAQACENAPEMQETVKKESGKRFRTLSPGCFFYAVFAAFCLYRNTSGITYPFFVGGTLCFFLSYFKRSGVTAAKDRRFLMTSALLLGILNCTTDSWVLIFFNRSMILLLLGVWLLESFYENSPGWRLGTWLKSLLQLFFGGLSQILRPLEDGYWYYKLKEKKTETNGKQKTQKKKLRSALLGVGLSLPVLMFILMLLGSADVLFGKMLERLRSAVFSWNLPDVLLRGKWLGALGLVLWGFFFTYGLLTYCEKKRPSKSEEEKAKRTAGDSAAAIAFTGMITAVYGLFCFVQIFGLFLGKMTLPEGWTYAGYARQGFFQLLFLSIFNVCMVLCIRSLFRENKWLRLLLTVLSGCTYILIASSAYRMLLYIRSYQLTFLRVFVLWALLMIALALGGVIWFLWKQNFGLFRYLLITLVIGYLVFSAAHPDYWIARYNVNRLVNAEGGDLRYITQSLSLDAAPAVCSLSEYADEMESPTGIRSRLKEYEERVSRKTQDMHIRSWNASRSYAEFILTFSGS